MAAFDSPHSAFGGTGLIGRTGTLLTESVAALLTWNDLRVSRKTLAALSDQQLSDIGLDRCDLPNISAKFPLA